MALPHIEMLEVLARQLHEELNHHGVKAATKYIQVFVCPARRNSSGLLFKTSNDNQALQLFFAVCEKMNLYSSAVICYLYNKEDGFEQEKFISLLRLLDRTSAIRMMEYALQESNWEFLRELLEAKPKIQALSVLKTLIYDFSSVPSARYMIKKMLKRGDLRKENLVNFVIFFIKSGEESLFEFVVKNNIIPLNEVIEHIPEGSGGQLSLIASVLSIIINSFSVTQLGSRCDDFSNTWIDMLCTATKSGLSTHHADLTLRHGPHAMASPIAVAAFLGNVHVVRLLYRSGATTNAELCLVKGDLDRSQFQPSESAEEEAKKAEVYKYVSRAARHPRRLQDLCLLAVSHCVGCRDFSDRDNAVHQIAELTRYQRSSSHERQDTPVSTLGGKVLFYDVLLDFAHKESYRAQNRDPPGFQSDDMDEKDEDGDNEEDEEERKEKRQEDNDDNGDGGVDGKH